MTGDFNDILEMSEKKGGRPASFVRCHGFRQRIDNCDLMDLIYQGPKFTWYNGRRGIAGIWERLDRSLVNLDWKEIFPNAIVMNLPRTDSDHSPILTLYGGSISRTERPFRLESTCLDPSFTTLVKERWNRFNSIEQAIQCLPPILLQWNKEAFRYIFHKNAGSWIELMEF